MQQQTYSNRENNRSNNNQMNDRNFISRFLFPGNTNEIRESASLLNPMTSIRSTLMSRSAQRTKSNVRRIVTQSYLNLLLIFFPIGIIIKLAAAPAKWVFMINFLAIIPLANLLGFATEELATHVGSSVGGLINATFGNLVELIISLSALFRGQLRILQLSMIGSVLSNILLILGCCFIAGGASRSILEFNSNFAQTMCGLMTLSLISILIPASFYSFLEEDTANREGLLLKLSRVTSMLLLVTYVMFLYFQLKSHASELAGDEDELSDNYNSDNSDEDVLASDGLRDSEAFENSNSRRQNASAKRHMSTTWSIALLLATTVCVAFSSEFLIGSIDETVEQTGLNKAFVGLILLPIVANAAEHATAVVVSYKHKMNLAIHVTLGSSMQIALFVLPLLVLIAWTIGQPLTLNFKPFETIIVFSSVILVNSLINDGKSHYFEGFQLIIVYLIISYVFWLYPEDKETMSAIIGK